MPIASALTTNLPGGDISYDQNTVTVRGTVTPSGNYTTGGDTFDLTAVTKPIGTLGIPPSLFNASTLPMRVNILGINGYAYAYVKGTTRANGKIKVMTAPNTEITGGAAYPANVTGDTITFEAVFAK